MDIVKTGIGITRTIKNVSRFKEIMTVLARNGFDELIIKMNIANHIPAFVVPKARIEDALKDKEMQGKSEEYWSRAIGYRLRKSFEELGPGFIKIGQLLATRDDVFPDGFVCEMRKLRNQVKSIPLSEGREIIARSLGRAPDEIFEYLAPEPLGTASIGVVYAGRLKGGEKIVIKVRRPNIVEDIDNDFDILCYIVERLEKFSGDIQVLGLSKMIRDFGLSIRDELDFRIEAKNITHWAEQIKRYDGDGVFHVPEVKFDYVTEEVLVMEHLEGTPFTDTLAINKKISKLKPVMEKGLAVLAKCLLEDGFFHADLHGGNFFFMPDERIGIIDFGLVGRIPRQSRASLVVMLYAMSVGNEERLVHEFLDVAEYEKIPDVDALVRDVRRELLPFMGQSAGEVDYSTLLRRLIRLLAEKHIYFPREWFLVFRAIITMDSVAKSLDADFDVFGIMQKEVSSAIKKLISRKEMIEEGLWIGRDLLSAIKIIPQHLKWFVKETARRGHAFEVIQRGYEEEYRSVASSLKFVGFAFLAGLLLLSGVILVGNPGLAGMRHQNFAVGFMWVGSLLMFIRGYWGIRK